MNSMIRMPDMTWSSNQPVCGWKMYISIQFSSIHEAKAWPGRRWAWSRIGKNVFDKGIIMKQGEQGGKNRLLLKHLSIFKELLQGEQGQKKTHVLKRLQASLELRRAPVSSGRSVSELLRCSKPPSGALCHALLEKASPLRKLTASYICTLLKLIFGIFIAFFFMLS